MRGDPRPADPVVPAASLTRPATYEELNELCRGITTSFVHLETRDAYGTEVELPHMAKWRRGEPDDFAWLDWWLQMLRDHRSAGRTCRRARIVSLPLSDYQRWTLSRPKVRRRRRGYSLRSPPPADHGDTARQRRLLRLR